MWGPRRNVHHTPQTVKDGSQKVKQASPQPLFLTRMVVSSLNLRYLNFPKYLRRLCGCATVRLGKQTAPGIRGGRREGIGVPALEPDCLGPNSG